MSLYENLGVSENATQEEIKKGYKKQASKNHPDKKGGSDEKFKKIKDSYMILKDEHKRKTYDELGEISLVESTAEASLRMLFTSLVSAGLFENDVLTMTRDKIEEEVDKAEAGVNSNQLFVDKLEMQLGRYKTESKNNIYESVIEQNIKKSKRNIEGFEMALINFNQMKELLNKYYDAN